MPLPTLKAIPQCSPKFPWRATRTPEGWRGQQFWKANRADITAAMTAPELPAPGTAFGGSAPATLVRRNMDAIYQGGGDNATTGRCGWTILELQYSTPDGNFGGAPERESGVAWCELTGGVEQVTQVFDVLLGTGSPPAGSDVPINQGDGIPLDVGRSVIVVHKYWPLASVTPALIAKLKEWKWWQYVNDANVTLPLVNGISGTNQTIGAGKLRFHDYELPGQRIDDGLVEIKMTLIEAPVNHKYTEWKRDALGNAVSSRSINQYFAASFAGLW